MHWFGPAHWPLVTAKASSMVRVEKSGRVCRIVLDRREHRNALDEQMLRSLITNVAAALADPAVGCIALASSHPRTFCAGGDLRSKARTDLERHALNGLFVELIEVVSASTKPTVAIVGGHCLAAGLGLALACDVVLASETATFGAPELNVGMFPFLNVALVSRNIGRKQARELLLLGECIDAETAARLGIVNRVVGTDVLEEVAAEWCERLADRSPLLMRLGKTALAETEGMGLGSALRYLQHYVTLAQATEDAREGIAAFNEKRAPIWQGR